VIDTNITNIKNLNGKINNISALVELALGKLVELMGNDANSENRKEEIIAEIKKINTNIQRLAMTKNDMDILAAFGHKG
jgi:flagellin-like hook-associated protein FlgL